MLTRQRRPISTTTSRWLVAALLLLSGTAAAQPDGCKLPAGVLEGPPPRSGDQPVEVGIGIYVIDLIEINDVEQTFTADFLFSLSWRDPRLAESGLGFSLAGCSLTIADIWRPYVDILNRRSLDGGRVQPLSIEGDGTVLYRERVLGELVTPLFLPDFPFDTQRLAMDVASFRYGPETVVLVPNRERMGRRSNFSIGGWELGEGEAKVTSEYLEAQDRRLSKLEFRVPAKRQSGYYIWKVFVPLSLIVLMAWSVFWLDPAQPAPQVSVSTASVLTLVAFQLSLGYILPRLAYLTRIDRFVLGATGLVFLALGDAIASNWLVRKGHPERAASLERGLRWLYLILFAGVWVVTVAF